jgi:mannose-1-phosphate guanylyltransferase
MRDREDCWALLLAAGDGRRLVELTTTGKGLAVPKQFCSLRRGASLLQSALERAAAITSSERICAVVAADHRKWWSAQLESLPTDNIFVQPRNRGTANGILFPLLKILQRDPDARILLLPSDHHVRDEETLSESISVAATRSRSPSPEIVLMGLRPRNPDPELGYIVPGPDRGGGYREVEQFIERPLPAIARQLIDRGALWNAFIIAADAPALLKLFERRSPDIVDALSEIISAPTDHLSRERRLFELYEALPTRDFSRQILPGHEHRLRVLPVPECGWSDLGTPRRVAEVLSELEDDRPPLVSPGIGQAHNLSLAAQHERVHARWSS